METLLRSEGEERSVDGEAGGTEANGWLLRSLVKTAATDVLGTPVPLLRRTHPSPPRLLLEVEHLHQHFFCSAPPR